VWSIEPREGALRAAGVAAYLAAVVVFLLAQGLGLRLRDEEQRAWWAGTGRDVLNAAGLVAIGGALRLLGLSWPAALLVGGTLALAMFGLSVLFATQLAPRHARAWTLGAGLAVALPLLLFAPEVARAFASVAARLFPSR
jgi:hypothetical protein